ncbi:alginate O-acetyltransferase [Alkalimarinus alittae]|uniref:Alginate biosynthesis protein AlgX n=1 Tax=Alkalimarinus alittae TaxID=2961619 RepID=A0ABY6N2G6_9ALTE|nr:alginate O-acetyltransferase [Alkalimarinus alittae]UZE96305.1 hypothetical protein NKI27_00750 [Alkalimarinus alittae]
MKTMSIFRPSAVKKALTVSALMALYAPYSAAEPHYALEACCSLCPEVNDPASYNTEFLKVSQHLVAGTDGWLYRTKLDLDESFEINQRTLNEMNRFRAALAAKGTELVMVYQPTRGLINPDGVVDAQYDFIAASNSYNQALQQIRDTGIIVPNLETLINDGSTPDFYFRRDAHWTPYGAKLTAQLVADTITKLSVYSSITETKYKNNRVGLLNVSGSHQKAAYLICGTQFPEQYVNEFEASTIEEGESDLFSDASLPEIVAAGTSFTKAQTNYNFVGYLKEFLSRDVLNIGQAGGGVIGSLLQYLPTEDYQEAPPKLLIWEVPSYTSLSNSFNYRQLIPLVDNGCAAKPKVLSSTISLKTGNNEVLFNGGGQVKNLLSGDYLLDIQFNNPDIKRLQAKVWYHNSRKENITLKHRDRVNSNGRFVFELRSEDEWKDFIFTSFDIKVDDSYPQDLKVTASLCQRSDSELR